MVLTDHRFCRYHLKDVIVGKIYFLLVRIKIKHMEIDIIKRETTGTGPNVYHENDTIAKYEIMDGAPVRGNDEVFFYLIFKVNELRVSVCCTLNLPLTCCAAGESIPIRLFLAGYEMTPTMRDINKKFSVRYYLNLVLIDEEERRYFKQQVHILQKASCWLGSLSMVLLLSFILCLVIVIVKSLSPSHSTVIYVQMPYQ